MTRWKTMGQGARNSDPTNLGVKKGKEGLIFRTPRSQMLPCLDFYEQRGGTAQLSNPSEEKTQRIVLHGTYCSYNNHQLRPDWDT